jgi:HD superfamily phosphohydrolase
MALSASTSSKKACAVRDPIHEWIKMSAEEKLLIDQPLVQRLRHACQLSGADLVFPGGVHNRFSHVLGVMHTSGEFARVLYPDDPHRIQIARLAGLLHDIGHGPFSHAYDSAVYEQIYHVSHHGHDIHRKKIIFHPPLTEAIRRCGVEPEEILEVWEGRDRVLHAITQGPVGADRYLTSLFLSSLLFSFLLFSSLSFRYLSSTRIDFLMRDSYYTGTSQLGNVLPHRIMGGIRIVKDPVDGQDTIAYVEKVMDDVINLLLSRVHMYKAVYNNKVPFSPFHLTDSSPSPLLLSNTHSPLFLFFLFLALPLPLLGLFSSHVDS